MKISGDSILSLEGRGLEERVKYGHPPLNPLPSREGRLTGK